MDKELKLVLNNEMQWSEKWIEYYVKHSQVFRFYEEHANDIRKRLRYGEKVLMKDRPSVDIYTILLDDKEVGIIKVTPYTDDPAAEINISILDEFSGQQIASKAIKKILDKTSYPEIIGVVYDSNKCEKIMNHIFNKLGFDKKEEFGVTEWSKRIEKVIKIV